MSGWHAVAKVGALKAGDVIAVEAGGVPMILGLDGDRYFAMQRQCVHRGGDLADGIVVARSRGVRESRLAVLDRDRPPRLSIGCLSGRRTPCASTARTSRSTRFRGLCEEHS